MIGDVIRNLFSLDDDDDDDEVCEALTPRRIMQEIAVFKRKNVPENEYHFFLNGKKPYAVFAAHPRENVYTLHMDLREFPNEPPKVFVTKMLRDYDGEKMDSVDGSMHVLESEHGWTRICHYGGSSWTPNVSLYKIYVKCCLWLLTYEFHLEEGKPIDYYLNHQK